MGSKYSRPKPDATPLPAPVKRWLSAEQKAVQTAIGGSTILPLPGHVVDEWFEQFMGESKWNAPFFLVIPGEGTSSYDVVSCLTTADELGVSVAPQRTLSHASDYDETCEVYDSSLAKLEASGNIGLKLAKEIEAGLGAKYVSVKHEVATLSVTLRSVSHHAVDAVELKNALKEMSPATIAKLHGDVAIARKSRSKFKMDDRIFIPQAFLTASKVDVVARFHDNSIKDAVATVGVEYKSATVGVSGSLNAQSSTRHESERHGKAGHGRLVLGIAPVFLVLEDTGFPGSAAVAGIATPHVEGSMTSALISTTVAVGDGKFEWAEDANADDADDADVENEMENP